MLKVLIKEYAFLKHASEIFNINRKKKRKK